MYPLRNFLTSAEVELLFMHAKNGHNPERNHCMLMMAFIHGLRASELLMIRLSDLDLKGYVLYIRRLKNGFSTQHPLLREEVINIRHWLKIRSDIYGANDSPYLFISLKGTPLTRQQFYNIIQQVGVRAELPVPVHPHMLRHSCGYALANAGIDTRLIQDYLGHRNIRHTVLYTASNASRFQGIWRRHKRK
ncbi:fimbrial regulatory protein FimB [Citrobacter freundii]|nr:fimbrial regulatory protein FimB [Citrobacter freundii]